MIRLLHALTVAVFALANSAGTGIAHATVHCDTQLSGAHDDLHDHGGHATLPSDAADQVSVPPAADPVQEECSQHFCSIYSIATVGHAREQVKIAGADRPSDTSISCLNRPESLYRPPDV